MRNFSLRAPALRASARTRLALLSFSGLLLLAAAGCTPPPQVNQPPPAQTSCEAHTECGEGEVCVGGQCRPGECVQELQSQCGPDAPDDVAPYCCKPWEFCNPLNECTHSGSDVIGTQCEVSDDCPGVGQFCSGGTCYSPENRDACTASHQCPAGERCDRTVFLCVPDNGGCTFADQLPELACEPGQVCDTETGFCLDPGEAECTTTDDCRAGQQCDDLGRCVQCLADSDCGPGTECNAGTGACVPVGQRCDNGETCPGNKVCIESTGLCETPQCEDDDDCQGSELCDLSSYRCYLPPAVCDEDDEPNDSLAEATEIPISGYAGTLCRSNMDFLAFPVQGNKRYRATVEFPDYDTDGIQLSMMNTEGQVTDQDTFGFERELTVTGITTPDETGTFYVRINGLGTDADEWAYTVTIEETEAPQQVDCAQETTQGIEPNNGFDTAYPVTPGQPVTFARCGTSDIDYYRVQVDPLHGVAISVEHDRNEGDLDVYLYDGPNNSDRIDSSTSSSAVERVDGPEGATEFWVKVELWGSDNDADPNQAYTLTAVQVPRPEACNTDVNEPDGSIDTAGALDIDTQVQAIRCNATDADYFLLTVPANRGGQLRIDFTHSQGDLKLDLLRPDGTTISSSNRVPAGNSEYLDLPFSAADAQYLARVGLNSGSGSPGQQYIIQATTYDASACTLSEPTPNDTLNTGQCLGTFETDVACIGPVLSSQIPSPGLATCQAATDAIEGCGTVCGVGDKDWYRVGKLNNSQVLRARLEHDPAGGKLGLALVRMNADPSQPPNVVARDFNSTGASVLELALVAPNLDPAFVREYGVLVQPEGDGAFNAQPYALEIEVSEPCVDDSYEPNDSRAGSALLREGATPGVAYDSGAVENSLCLNDLDVFDLYAFAGETVRATLEGPEGTTVYLGRRSSDDTAVEPEPLPGGEGVLDDATGAIVATFENDATQQIFVTVKRTDSGAIGPYTLRIEVLP